MNFPTHVMFGIAVGAVFFGKPEVILLVGFGSAIPDLDREYGFLSKESFTRRQVHRALCHNFLFLGLVYLVNPFLGLGAFLHTLLDALTTARDRGVEWLYPFTRLVNRAAYDYNGDRIEPDPNHKIYLLQNELPVLTKETTKDLKPGYKTLPWRRTYGPALSGGLLDQGIFLGSVAIALLLLFSSALSLQKFIDLEQLPGSPSFYLPFWIGVLGVGLSFVEGELGRKQLIKKFKPDRIYQGLFYVSVGIMLFALVLGAVMNPQVVLSTASDLPYIAAGIGLVVLASFAVLKIRSSKPVPTDATKEPSIV
ncbi:MAG TPA: metal-dependent hydrolase [Nitrososphaerales archaeon]|nr:metal-dependent hydrolase [Nitrososphaerales archaeon]